MKKKIVLFILVAILSTSVTVLAKTNVLSSSNNSNISEQKQKIEKPLNNETNNVSKQGQRPNKKPDSKPGGDRVPPEFMNSGQSKQPSTKHSNTNQSDAKLYGTNNKSDELNEVMKYMQSSPDMNRQSPVPPKNFSKK